MAAPPSAARSRSPGGEQGANVLAYEAVAALREQGRAARRMEDGFPEWRAAGLPVEAATH